MRVHPADLAHPAERSRDALTIVRRHLSASPQAPLLMRLPSTLSGDVPASASRLGPRGSESRHRMKSGLEGAVSLPAAVCTIMRRSCRPQEGRRSSCGQPGPSDAKSESGGRGRV
jgi:hypothetical protein